jgi:hypothetical protein
MKKNVPSRAKLSPDVADRPGRRHRGGAHRQSVLGAHARRRRLLDDLLVPALHRAIALEQVHRVAVRVGEDLDLDVSRCYQVFLDQHAVVTKCGGGLAPRRRQCGSEIACRVDHPHPLAAPAGGCLDQHRESDAQRLSRQHGGVLVVAMVAGHQRDSRRAHDALGGRLGAHCGDRRWRRADEHQPGPRALGSERVVLGKETVAGVDRLRAGLFRGGDDRRTVEIAVARRRRADSPGFVAGGHMQCGDVGIGVDGDRVDAHPARRAGDAAGDFAAVGNQDPVKHRALRSRRRRSVPGGCGRRRRPTGAAAPE